MTSRVLYQDVIPYDTPSSIEALAGPCGGVLVLPITVHWGPEPTADLSTPDGVEKAYESLVREGTTQQQEELLDAELLRRVWPGLRLPQRCRDLWESRFPDLARS
ncbi:transcriptional regulator [Humibacillus sp. DSM 29435]|uniref:transcriptional regulator n=1 Tax=Humibacillus sp. DSM 29435 TaxID=1869167 RepID=UPI001113180F|nr:transcriptional regulator [Humibacillus sp. DSM 29435]